VYDDHRIPQGVQYGQAQGELAAETLAETPVRLVETTAVRPAETFP
jgi:hypothetical protein